MHVILDRRAKSPEAVVSDNILAKVISQGRHRWKIQRKAVCFQAIVRGLFEHNADIYYFKISAWSEFRSTLKTSESLEWRTSARPKAHIMWPEQRAFVKIFPVCQVLCSFLSAQKGEKRITSAGGNRETVVLTEYVSCRQNGSDLSSLHSYSTAVQLCFSPLCQYANSWK